MKIPTWAMVAGALAAYWYFVMRPKQLRTGGVSAGGVITLPPREQDPNQNKPPTNEFDLGKSIADAAGDFLGALVSKWDSSQDPEEVADTQLGPTVTDDLDAITLGGESSFQLTWQ